MMLYSRTSPQFCSFFATLPQVMDNNFTIGGNSFSEIEPNSNGKEGSCASIECNTELENPGEGLEKRLSAALNNQYESENNSASASEVYIGKDVSTGPLERRNQDEEISFNALDIKRKQLTRDCSVAP